MDSYLKHFELVLKYTLDLIDLNSFSQNVIKIAYIKPKPPLNSVCVGDHLIALHYLPNNK